MPLIAVLPHDPHDGLAAVGTIRRATTALPVPVRGAPTMIGTRPNAPNVLAMYAFNRLSGINPSDLISIEFAIHSIASASDVSNPIRANQPKKAAR